jgi:TolB-like protein
MKLRVRLLGTFDARFDTGAPVAFATKKERALLAYLALRPGRAYSRDALTGLLWASRGDEQARGSLRRTLSDLRKALGDSASLTSDGDLIALAPDGIEVDVVAFERCAASEEAPILEQSVALYQGELLAGFGLREDAFEDWLRIERARLRALALTATQRLIAHHVRAGAPERAIDTAARLLSIDPAHEPTHRTLMSLYASLGRRSEAVRQYAACRDALVRDLGIEPDAATEALYREIQAQEPASNGKSESAEDDQQLPDKPSIAVLPFVNLTSDPEQEFFADGLTEDIIAALSRVSALWVTARNSTFTYKGKAVAMKEVARDLCVRYVMEGSVRRSGERLRVTARLADAINDREVWAERYDRPIADLFDIQDEITRSVAASTDTQIRMAEGRLIAELQRTSPTVALQAKDLVARAWDRLHDQTLDALDEASDLVDQALRLDANDPGAHRVRASVHMNRLWFGELPHDEANRALAMDLARTALRLAPNDELAHLVMAWAWAYAPGRLEDAIAECERGLEINPNSSLILANLGTYLAALGRSEESIAASTLALRLNPRDSSNFWRHYAIAVAEFTAGHDAAALEGSRRIARSRWHVPSGILWAAAAAGLGDADEARAAVDYCLSQRPDLTIDRVVPDFMLRFARETDHQRLMTLLKKAGLPE